MRQLEAAWGAPMLTGPLPGLAEGPPLLQTRQLGHTRTAQPLRQSAPQPGPTRGHPQAPAQGPQLGSPPQVTALEHRRSPSPAQVMALALTLKPQ